MPRDESDPARKGRPEGREFLRSSYLSPEASRWLERLNQAVEEDELLMTDAGPKAIYVNSIAIAIMGALQRGISLDQPLESVISILDQNVAEEEQISDEWLEMSSSVVAEKWLKDNPNSSPALTVKEEGLTAPLITHARFFMELYNRFLDSEKVSQKNPPFTITIKREQGKPKDSKSSKQEGLQHAMSKMGQSLIDFINYVAPETLTEDEIALARYYRFAVAVALMGETREEYLSQDPVQRETETEYLKLGAVLAAENYLSDFPDDPFVLDFRAKGMSLPDANHRNFFNHGMFRNAMMFIRKHNPHLERRSNSSQE